MEIHKPVIILFFLIILIILVFLFVIPKYQQYHDLQLTISEKQAEYSGESIYYARVSDILLGLKNRSDVLEKINSALPPDFSVSSLVYFLQQKEIENKVSVSSIAFSELSEASLSEVPLANPSAQIKNVMFTLTAVGNYQGLKNFLLDMDNSSRLFEVDTVSLEPLQGLLGAKSKFSQYSLKLEVKTHTY